MVRFYLYGSGIRSDLGICGSGCKCGFSIALLYREVSNQNLHATSATDMVIIIPASGKLYAQAERLAEAHRSVDGLRVQIVRADQIYNEFSSGTPDATAYRRFMKMLYDRAATDADMPRYLLLFGDGMWDNRMITADTRGLNPDDYLLCYESENSLSHTSSFVMEDYFGLLDDGEGDNLMKNKIDLGIGRFPVTTERKPRFWWTRRLIIWRTSTPALGEM